MKTKEKYNYLIKNTMLFTIANFSNKLIIFFLLPFYTAFLTTEEYAVIDMISVTQQLIFPILTLDITEAIIRFGIEKKNNKKNVLFIGIIFILVGNIVLLFGCLSAIALSIGVKKYILYFFVFNLVISIYTLFSSFLRTIDKINLITVASILSTLVTTASNVFLIAKMKMGVDGYYMSYIIGNLIAILIMIIGSRSIIIKEEYNRISLKPLIKDMLRYAIPLIPNALFWWVNSSLDRYFLTALSGLTYVGMYAAANKIPSILNTVTSIVQQAWGLSLFQENDANAKKDFFDNVYRFYNQIIFLASISLIALSKILCGLLLNNEFFEAWHYVPILILGFYYNSISCFIGTEFTAAKKTEWILTTTLVSAFTNIALNIVLIKPLSCMGAAIATTISYFVLLEMRIRIINKKFALKINNIDILVKTFVMGIVTCSVLFFNNIINVIVFIIMLIIVVLKNMQYYRTIWEILKRRIK